MKVRDDYTTKKHELEPQHIGKQVISEEAFLLASLIEKLIGSVDRLGRRL